MWIFSKRLEELVEADVATLIGTCENQFLEFKELYARKDPAARFDILRDISSIANAEGGVLIIGVAEDGDGQATAIVPVPEARVEADRVVSICLAGLKDRIAGLRTHPVPVQGGHIVVVQIPTSYRRPHMVVADGLNELWIRHDRQKSRMTLDEIRASVLGGVDPEMKVEQFIRDRRDQLGAIPNALFGITATPLSLGGGRVLPLSRGPQVGSPPQVRNGPVFWGQVPSSVNGSLAPVGRPMEYQRVARRY